MPQPAWVKGRLQPEPATSRWFYNTFLKRSSTYNASVITVALVVGIGYDYFMNAFWDSCNRGVRLRYLNRHPSVLLAALALHTPMHVFVCRSSGITSRTSTRRPMRIK